MKMRIGELARFCGVSVRTLRYYDEIGLLKPGSVDRQTGYRFYGEEDLLRMQEILFYRELDFPLKTVRQILSAPDYNKEEALSAQRTLLTLKKERLETLICAIDKAMKGEVILKAFDNSTYEAYKAEAKERWGNTWAYQEYSEKAKSAGKGTWQYLNTGMDHLMEAFARCRETGAPAQSPEAQKLVKELQSFITDNFYTCTGEILAGLGQMYVQDPRFRKNIDRHGTGTAGFISQAISTYCQNNT